MKKTFKKIFKKLEENNLFPFLFFLLVSCCLWLLQTLNVSYETGVSFDISIQHVPDNVELDRSGTIETDVVLRDKGTVIAKYKMMSKEPLQVDYSDFVYKNGVLSLPLSVLKSQVQDNLEATTSFVRFAEDTLHIAVKQNRKLLPVRVNGRIDAAEHYEVSGIEIVPSNVMVHATPDVLEKMEFVNTEFVVKRYLKGDKVIPVKVSLGGALDIEPVEVKLHVNISPLKVKKVRVHVENVNFPRSYHAMWLPTEVELTFEVSPLHYELLGSGDFSVQIDYNDIVNAHGRPVEIKLVKTPSQAKNVEYVPSSINVSIL